MADSFGEPILGSQIIDFQWTITLTTEVQRSFTVWIDFRHSGCKQLLLGVRRMEEGELRRKSFDVGVLMGQELTVSTTFPHKLHHSDASSQLEDALCMILGP